MNPSSNSRTVMIVEDEPETAEMFAEMMRLSGFKVVTTHSGAVAMNLLRQEIPDVLVLDIMMPVTSGLEVLRFMRNESRLERVPVIIVSAKSMPADIKKGLDAGATIYLTKPVTFLDLKKAVDDLIAEPG